MEFSIDPASRLPICRQLSSQIREAMAGKTPAAGAAALGAGTFPHAGGQSRHDRPRLYGFGAGGDRQYAAGAGRLVARMGNDLSRKARRERLREAADLFLTEAVHLGFTAEEVRALVLEQLGQFQWGDASPQ